MPEVDEWVKGLPYRTTAEVPVPERLIDQVIGQDEAVDLAKKAALQHRHLILVGPPGTGKSMIAQAMTEFLPREELEDILVFHNEEDPNRPRIVTVPAGRGKQIVEKYRREAEAKKASRRQMVFFSALILVLMGLYVGILKGNFTAMFMAIIAAVVLVTALSMFKQEEKYMVPKLLVSHFPGERPPFVDATGAHAGALLGDVRHDPYQSGGLETPPHLRVEAGAIHKAHKGVLFIDEINLLSPESQTALLTAMQEKKFPISGRSEHSAGAMVMTEPVPCDFILVAAGNLESIRHMHPALRSRIKGYGYEIYIKTMMPDTDENRRKLVRFVAQEVKKDGKIPHFDMEAVAEIIKEAQRMADRKGYLTLRLRELGGLVRAAGDLAKSEGSPVVRREHVIRARRLSRGLEKQIVDRIIEFRKDYKTFYTEGARVGIVNGLAVLVGSQELAQYSGIVLPIVAEVTPAMQKDSGKIIATGKLGEIAKEAVTNVSAIVKKYMGRAISDYDIHIQFIGTYEGVEGDSASISVATAVISALEEIPVRQDVAMTGSLDVRGRVLPVGAVTAKVEAAIEAGFRKVIIPKDNLKDLVLGKDMEGRIEIVPAETIWDVLEHSLVSTPRKESLMRRIMKSLHVDLDLGRPAPS
ncbi:MAG: ATP-dependent protease LonB [Thermoplasmata archaeon]|nr:MAG: ATP-dependent protease LonB [Thermoplasmata archaeon]HDJ27374.1 ATP-dependent protease LonB [Aciduliprofundum sp.]